ncbi:hypothetical protein [Myroides guanonis]|uniref:Uncharacterized protein n=1 Tax=Myroides guanonis TaxID=1150112 RepID=A0A1I3PLY7_9FLAO|nr:hypothetical protein [Myroides guanonis]SFJ22379.1 hypothetical protein SAMN04487893_104174 [Myroides guanonis]
MSQIIEKFIRKLNNTELNVQSTNDAYIRVSTEIQTVLPSDFLSNLDSKKEVVQIKKTGKKELFPSNKWLRYQHYPSNDEYRIVSIAELLNRYKATAGDFVIIEKITDGSDFHYEVSMRVYEKISMKYNKGKNAFEILNLHQVSNRGILEEDIDILFEGKSINSKISLVSKEKKKANSPTETSYYKIENLPDDFQDKLERDSFIEIVEKGGKFYLSIEKSWEFNKIEI